MKNIQCLINVYEIDSKPINETWMITLLRENITIGDTVLFEHRVTDIFGQIKYIFCKGTVILKNTK